MFWFYLTFTFLFNPAVQKGQKAPDFTGKTPKGKEISLSDFKGDVILLDFWASWCRPCRIKNPEIVEIYNKYKKAKFKNGAKFQIISVSLDQDADKWAQAIKKDGLKWKTHVSDLKGWRSAISSLYDVSAIPNIFLIDQTGTIVATREDLSGLNLHVQIDNLLDL